MKCNNHEWNYDTCSPEKQNNGANSIEIIVIPNEFYQTRKIFIAKSIIYGIRDTYAWITISITSPNIGIENSENNNCERHEVSDQFWFWEAAVQSHWGQ